MKLKWSGIKWTKKEEKILVFGIVVFILLIIGINLATFFRMIPIRVMPVIFSSVLDIYFLFFSVMFLRKKQREAKLAGIFSTMLFILTLLAIIVDLVKYGL